MADRFQQPEVVQQPRRFPWGLAFFVVCLIALYSITAGPAVVPEGWGTDYEAALTQATTGKRNVVVAFHMSACPPCLLMDRTVLGSSAVQEALGGFVPVRVDVDERRDLSARFGVFATPTYAVLDTEGRLVARCEGYQSVKAFVTFLERGAAASLRDRLPKGPRQPGGS